MATAPQEGGDSEAGIIFKYHLQVIIRFLNFTEVN